MSRRAYRAPPFFVRRIANPLVTLLGLAPTLAVQRRRSGGWQTVPVNVLEVGGGRYLVSVRGETQWARNLRAAGEGELRRRGKTERFRATEIPVDDRVPLIAAYRGRWDRQVKTFFEALPEPADHPVFRIETPG